MRRLYFVSLFFFVFTGLVNSQAALPEYAHFTPAEVAMKECSFDKSADAVVLFDEGFSNYDDEYQLITSRRIRIKIFNERGTDHGTITIPFYSKDHFERIRSIEAVSYNPGGQPEISLLDKKSIFVEKTDENHSTVKFAIPNVKAGTILEYRYESVMKHYGGLRYWIFQSEIPTVKSSYLLQMLQNVEFGYVVTKKKEYPIVIKAMPEKGQTYYEMNNIPALVSEPYMDAPRDYLQKVEFQLASYRTQHGTKLNVNTTWAEMSKSLAADNDLGGTLKKSLPVPPELQNAVKADTSSQDKIRTIYNYVSRNFKHNGYNGIYAMEGLKSVVENRTGSTGEINLVLINYLQSFNIRAFPLIAADRSYGKIDPKAPLLDRFNKTVAFVEDNGLDYVLDATEDHLTIELIPYSLLNTFGLVVDKKEGKLLRLLNENAYQAEINIQSALNKTGMLSGKANVISFKYAKQNKITDIKADQDQYIAETLQSPYEGLTVTEFKHTPPEKDNITAPLLETIDFVVDDPDNTGYVFLKPNYFTELSKNPFTAKQRFTNVNFGYPVQLTMEQTIELPANAKIDKLPQDRTIESADRDIKFTRKMRKEGNKLIINLDFAQTVTLVPAADYNNLRDFYKEMTDVINEPLVIKLEK